MEGEGRGERDEGEVRRGSRCMTLYVCIVYDCIYDCMYVCMHVVLLSMHVCMYVCTMYVGCMYVCIH